ncbi:MAG: RidA family protein [Nitrospinota bacterium]
MNAGLSERGRPGFKREIRTGASGDPFPAAVESRGFTFVGAIGGVDESGKVVSALVSEQAARAIRNLAEVLAANGQGLEHVVKCTVYLTDAGDASTVEGVLKDAFPEDPPALSRVEVKGLPDGQKFAIEAVAVRPPEGRDVYDFMG